MNESSTKLGAETGRPAASHALSGAEDNRRRMRAENLLSFIVISSGDIDRDTRVVRDLSDMASEEFLYYEILVVSGRSQPGWRSAMKDLGSDIHRLRVIKIPNRETFDAVVLPAMELAIGDFAVVFTAGEIDLDDLDRILAELADGQTDLVRVVFDPTDRGPVERFGASLARSALRMATGETFLRFPARAAGLSRAGITRILTAGGHLRFFRLIELSEFIDERTLIVREGHRKVWGSLATKFRIISEVFSVSAIRIVRLVALVCFLLALLSFAATIASFVIWLFMTDIAPGWTSLSMLLSLLFGSNFAILGAISLGIVRVIHQFTPNTDGRYADEVSGGDLFDVKESLNVKTNDRRSGS